MDGEMNVGIDVLWDTEWIAGLPQEMPLTVADIQSLAEDRLEELAEPLSEGVSSASAPSSHSLFRISPEKAVSPEFVPHEYKARAVSYWISGKKLDKFGNAKKKAFSTVRNQFKLLKSLNQLYK